MHAFEGSTINTLCMSNVIAKEFRRYRSRLCGEKRSRIVRVMMRTYANAIRALFEEGPHAHSEVEQRFPRRRRRKTRYTESGQSVFTFVFSGHPEGSRGSESRSVVSGAPRATRKREKQRAYRALAFTNIRAVRSHAKYKRSQL